MAIVWYGSLFTVVIWPPVMSIAMPRPAVMITRVAMIGWIPTTATRNPLNTPIRRQTSTALPSADSTTASDSGLSDAAIWDRATAPAIAMTAPTDRSMPRVAMTSVMPRATSSSTLERRTMSIGPP